MANDELDELVDLGHKLAWEKLKQSGEIDPTFILVGPTGEREIVEMLFSSQAEKLGVFRTMRERMKEAGYTKYVCVTENWSAPPLPGWRPGQPLLVPLREHPGAVETVIVTACNPDWMKRARWKLRRDDAGCVMALEDCTLPGDDTTGRLDFLQRDASAHRLSPRVADLGAESFDYITEQGQLTILSAIKPRANA
jgi:hypothetical protein